MFELSLSDEDIERVWRELVKYLSGPDGKRTRHEVVVELAHAVCSLCERQLHDEHNPWNSVLVALAGVALRELARLDDPAAALVCSVETREEE